MPDITPPVLPVSAATATTATTTPSPPLPATIVNLPDNVAQVGRQLDLSATLVQSPTSTAIVLDTSLGNITLSLTNLATTQQQAAVQQLLTLFDAQKPLTLIVNPGAPPTQAFLFLPSITATGSTVGLNNSPVANFPVAPELMPPSPALSVGSTLTAVVLPNDISLPNSTLPTASSNLASASAPLAGPLAGNPAAQPLFTPTQLTILPANFLQPGNMVNLQINATTLPNLPAPQITAPNQLIATVIGNGSDGQLILKTGDTKLFVKQNSDLPVGSNLLITLSPVKDDLPLTLPAMGNQTAASLPQLLSVLTQIDPQLARQVLENQLPQLNTALPATLLFMLGAIKQGDSRGWLGTETVDALNKAGKFELIQKLIQETSGDGQTVKDGLVGQWQSYPIPIFANSQLQIMSLYVRLDPEHQSNKNSEDRGSKFTRFVIDVNLTKLGPIQLDGFAQPKKLDMIVRSEHPLPDGLVPDLRNSYHIAMEGVGFAGSLNFQLGRKYWLTFQNGYTASTITT